MKIQLKLVNPGEVKRKIVKELASEVRQRIASNNLAAKVEDGASGIIRKHLITSPTTIEFLYGGALQGELGVPDSQKGTFESILSSIIDSVKVDVKFKSLTTKIDLKMTVSFQNDLSAYKGIGTYTTEKGRVIPWFQWLTELGDRVIVRDFISEGGHPKQSRTGDMIMVKGGGWRVPPQHAGSPGDNFITKAVDVALPEVTAYISRIFKRAF